MSAKLDVVLLTDARYEAPAEPDWYCSQILREEGLLADALRAEGLTCGRVAWSRPDFDWASVRAAVFRSTWDYFDRFAEFTRWLDRVSTQTTLINPVELIRWNQDKHYLGDLHRKGVGIPPTRFLEVGTRTSLPDLLAASGWERAVLKPAVSGAARHTHLIEARNAGAVDAAFQTLIAEEAMLLQRFEPAILTEGESSLIWMDGQVTHAVRKRANGGDYRVQDDYGGTVHPCEPQPDEIAFAERAVAACPARPLYARVDVIRDAEGALAVMELELIEPELFFRFCEPAAVRLAKAVARGMERG